MSGTSTEKCISPLSQGLGSVLIKLDVKGQMKSKMQVLGSGRTGSKEGIHKRKGLREVQESEL